MSPCPFPYSQKNTILTIRWDGSCGIIMFILLHGCGQNSGHKKQSKACLTKSLGEGSLKLEHGPTPMKLEWAWSLEVRHFCHVLNYIQVTSVCVCVCVRVRVRVRAQYFQ